MTEWVIIVMLCIGCSGAGQSVVGMDNKEACVRAVMSVTTEPGYGTRRVLCLSRVTGEVAAAR